jgi:hypothetical protein
MITTHRIKRYDDWIAQYSLPKCLLMLPVWLLFSIEQRPFHHNAHNGDKYDVVFLIPRNWNTRQLIRLLGHGVNDADRGVIWMFSF